MTSARTWKRSLAYFFDSLILNSCYWPLLLHIWKPMLEGHSVRIPINLLLLVGLLVVFYKWMFLFFLGATPGKLIMGIRVVNRWNPDQSLGLMQSFLRVFADGLSLFFGLAPRALALIRFDRTHISDWIAETQVVQNLPHSGVRRRWVLLAILIIYTSGPAHFMKAYRLFENSEISSGEIVIDPLRLF